MVGRFLRDASWLPGLRGWTKRGRDKGQPVACLSLLGPLDDTPALAEAQHSGWFRGETGELHIGFPVLPEDILVDVGCGDGGNASFCADRGARLILVDVDADSIAAAKKRLESRTKRAEFHVSDSNPLPVASGVASKVVCTEVLEHVDDPAQVMAELVRIGRPGALYLLAVPDPSSEHMMEKVAEAMYFQRPNHIRIFERQAFEQLVTSAGLMIEHRAFYSFYWTMWWLLYWSGEGEKPSSKNKLTDHWERLWGGLLAKPKGRMLKAMLDEIAPKSQIIIARKPQ
jgi:ubiquinone/menaquinone biosynthesis C-methylase UbiE